MSRTTFENAIGNVRQALDPRRPQAVDDAELLRRMLDGERGAFDAIVRRHAPAVTSAARQVLKEPADVDDVFQATFLVLHKSGHRIRESRSLGSWLYGVAHRLSVHARCRRIKQDRRERTNQPLPDATGDVPDLSWREASAVLHEELNRLPDRLRMPILLCHLEGKSREDAAAELGLSPGAVKGLLERGRLRLKNRLERRGLTFSVGLMSAVATQSAAQGTPSERCLDSTVPQILDGTLPPTIHQIAQGFQTMTTLKTVLLTSTLLAACLFGAVTLMQAGGERETPAQKAGEKAGPGAKAGPIAKAEPGKGDPAAETFTLSGKVVDADDKPVAGQALYVPVLLKDPPTSEADVGVKEIGVSAADGTFRVTVRKGLVSRYLIAYRPGDAMILRDVSAMTDRNDLVVKLEKEFPVRGRLLDTEGKPIAGATFEVREVINGRNGGLDKILKGYKTNWEDSLRNDGENREYFFPGVLQAKAPVSDAKGNFVLQALPRESIVFVEAISPNGSKQSFHVVTREGFDPKEYNEAALAQTPEQLRLPGRPITLSSPTASVVIPMGRTFEGTVVDSVTKKPIAGVTVSSGDHYSGQQFAVTGKDGKYRLPGVKKQKEYHLHAAHREGIEQGKTNYLTYSARIADTEGLSAITHDVTLSKGVVVTGRIVDKATKKGVTGHIRSAPLEGNPHFAAPGKNGYSVSRMSEPAREDGKFRLLAIPGKNVLMLQLHSDNRSGRNLFCPYPRAKPDPDHKDFFTKSNGEDTYYVRTAGMGTESLDMFHMVKVVDLPENGADDAEFRVDLEVEAGKTVDLKFVDEAGKPLGDNFVSGPIDGYPFVYKIQPATTTIVGLNGERKRQVAILNPARKLGASLVLTGNETGPVTVVLKPLGSFTGRILDTDGQPRADVSIGAASVLGQPISDLYRDAFGVAPPKKTDKEGRFTLNLVLPGIEYTLMIHQGKEYYVGEPRIGRRKVEAGKTTHLGDLKTKVQPN
jgi:RNA polymerase sigma factor (sigma-70 family)